MSNLSREIGVGESQIGQERASLQNPLETGGKTPRWQELLNGVKRIPESFAALTDHLPLKFNPKRVGVLNSVVVLMLLASAAGGAGYPGKAKIASADGPKPKTGAELVLSPGSVFGDLELPDANWLSQIHPHIQAAEDMQVQGKLKRKLVAINYFLYNAPPSSRQNTVIYDSECNTTGCAASEPILRTNLQIVNTMLDLGDGDKFLAGGQKTWMNGDLAIDQCSVSKRACNPVNLSANFIGMVANLTRLSDGTVIGNNFYSEGAPGQFEMQKDSSGNYTVKPITDATNGGYLQSARAPEVTNFDGVNKVRTISLAMERLAWGFDVTTTDLKAGTAQTNNYYANELGYVESKAVVTDSLGKALLVGSFFNKFITVVDLDPATDRPLGFSIPPASTANRLDNQNIPRLVLGSAMTRALGAGVDAQGNINVWSFGIYFTDDFPGRSYTSHAFAAHDVIKVDPVAKKRIYQGMDYWTDLAPREIATGSSSQSNLQFKTVNNQPGQSQSGYEYPVGGDNFSGMEFLPVNADNSPVANFRIIYPDNGLEKLLQEAKRYYINLPLVVKQFVAAAGW